jgi:hypothetical protein
VFDVLTDVPKKEKNAIEEKIVDEFKRKENLKN